MDLPRGLRAHDAAGAARVTGRVLLASAPVAVFAVLVDPSNATAAGQWASWSSICLLVAMAAHLRYARPDRADRRGVLLLVPLVGTAVVHVVNVITDDVSAAAQVLLVLPVLVGATQFRRHGAVLVTATAVLGNAAVIASVQPTVHGLTAFVFVGAALATLTWIIVQIEERQERLKAALERTARYDGLTGLLRRDALHEVLQLTAARGDVALLLIDVDGFKSVNDHHGHLVGDDALAHLAAVVREQVRSDDIAVGRLGGDELALVIPGCAAAQALARAGQLVAAVRARPLQLEERGWLHLTVSVGVSCAPAGATAVRELVAAADAALYRAKHEGRDRAAFARPGAAAVGAFAAAAAHRPPRSAGRAHAARGADDRA